MRRMRSRRTFATVVTTAVLAVLASACVPEPPADNPPPPPPEPPLAISTDPPLYPAFSAGITDYVARCTGAPVQVTVDAPSTSPVSVAGQPAATGHFVASVARTTGQSFTIATGGGAPSTYHVRCLPEDFASWTTSRFGPTSAEYYIVAPFLGPSSYVAIVDTNGVPVWWSPPGNSIFGTLLPNGRIGVLNADFTDARLYTLDGTLQTLASDDGGPELHDIVELPNGNYLVVVDRTVTPADAPDKTDFSSWGAAAPPAGAELLDHVLQEIEPDGTVVWEWVASDHISVAETDPQWYGAAKATPPAFLALPPGLDAFHWNSVEVTPTGYLLSFRHLNAVYHVDRATGAIDWKLGGTTTPESLTIAGDPVFDGGSHFGGQHDARLLADGTVSVYDNGTNLGRTGRVVRYVVDVWGVATMVEQVVGPAPKVSPWGGSGRRLSDGHWVIAFGGTDTFEELDAAGNVVFRWTMGAPVGGLYRAVPVAPGTFTREALRAGMDAQYP